MQLHQIEYFLAVAETLSFTRGAQQANVVQSAVSAAVRQLERELGSELFERRARTIRLTAAGTALLPRARDIVGAVRSARDAVDSVRGTVQGAVVLGTLAHLGSVDLVRILHAVHRDHPGVVVKLRQTILGTRTSLEEVRSGALDLALVSAYTGSVAGIELYPLHAERIVFVTPPGHRMAGRKEIDLAETAGESFIDFPDGWGNRTAVENAFAAAGLSRTINIEVVGFTMALDLVRENLGVAFLPASAVRGADGVSSSIVTDADLNWRIQLARSAARKTPAAEEVLIRALTAPNTPPSADPQQGHQPPGVPQEQARTAGDSTIILIPSSRSRRSGRLFGAAASLHLQLFTLVPSGREDAARSPRTLHFIFGLALGQPRGVLQPGTAA